MTGKYLSIALLLSLTTTATQVYAGAADKPESFALDEFVVTATRTMKEIRDIPSSVSVVTQKELQEKNITTVTEALETMPGVYLSKAAQGRLMIRGFSSADILVLLDGQQMNSTYNNTVEWEMLPVENIERIEVVRGAGSSLYGGRAVGAVVNIITKENNKKLGVNLAYSYGSHNTQKKAMYANVKANDKLSFGLGYEKRSSNGFKGYYYTAAAKKGAGSITPGQDIPQLSNGKYVLGGRGEKKWDNENYSFNIKYDFDKERSLKYSYLHNSSEYRYNNPFSNVLDKDGKPIFSGTISVGNNQSIKLSTGSFLGYDGKKESDMHILNYRDDKNNLALNLSYTDMTANGFSSPSAPTNINWTGVGTDSLYPGKTYNFDIQKAWKNLGKHTLLLGANYKEESFEQRRLYLNNWRDHGSVNTTLGRNGMYEMHGGKAKNLAVFIQDEYKFNKAWTMYLGARLDHFTKADGHSEYYDKNTGAQTRALKYEDVSYNQLSPKVSLGYKADEHTDYYISYGRSFNPPPLYQIYRDGGGEMGDVVANPNLNPETSNTFEIGMKKKLSKKTDLGIALYQVQTNDKIVYTSHYKPGTTDVAFKRYDNYGLEKRKGLELELNHRFDDKFSSYLNYAWQNGRVERDKVTGTNLKDVSSSDYGIPKHLLHAGIKYKNKKFKAALEAQYVSARQAPDAVSGEYNSEDAYFLLNTTFNYELAKNTTMQLSITNLLDRKFYAGEATAGRAYSVGLRYSF